MGLQPWGAGGGHTLGPGDATAAGVLSWLQWVALGCRGQGLGLISTALSSMATIAALGSWAPAAITQDHTLSEHAPHNTQTRTSGYAKHIYKTTHTHTRACARTPTAHRLDPIVSAGPAVATVVDATGLLVYLWIAKGIMKVAPVLDLVGSRARARVRLCVCVCVCVRFRVRLCACVRVRVHLCVCTFACHTVCLPSASPLLAWCSSPHPPPGPLAPSPSPSPCSRQPARPQHLVAGAA